MKKAIILARVSSREQEEGYSIDAQKDRLIRYCERKNLSVIKSYEIVESSTQGDRKRFMEMINFVKSQKERVAIVADKIDRIQRSFKEFPLLDELINKNIIELHFFTENTVIDRDSTSHTRLGWSFGVLMAQAYVDSLRDNVKRSFDYMVKQGEFPGWAPLGYLNTRDEHGKADIVLDSHRAPIIKRLFKEYAKGMISIGELTKLAKCWGLTRRKGGSITPSVMHYLLKNTFYYGLMTHKGEMYPHRYSKLISKELFDTCTSIREGKNLNTTKYNSKDFLFRGILTCKNTGRAISTDRKKKKGKNGNILQWTYLRGINPDDHSRYVYVREDKVENEIEAILKKISIPSNIAEKAIDQYLKTVATNEAVFHKRQLSTLKTQHSKVQTQIDRLMDMMLENQLTQEEFSRQKNRLRQKQVNLEESIEHHREADDCFKDGMVNILGLLSNLPELYKSSTNPMKRQLINIVLSNCQLDGVSLCYKIRKPFNDFANINGFEDWLYLLNVYRTDPEKYQVICSFAKQSELQLDIKG